MKRMIFLAASMMVLLMACFPASGQELKPLKSFYGNEVEYLKYNFGKNYDLFQGQSFENLINMVEAKFITAVINYDTQDENNFFMYLYLQEPDYVKNTARHKEWHLTGISVSFEKDNILKEATGKILESFPKYNRGPSIILLTKENADKLINLSKDLKIRKVAYRDTIMRTVGGPE